MALVACTECGKEVSDRATACIGCGAPIGESVGSGTVLATTQSTSKHLKLQQLYSFGMIIAGILLWFGSYVLFAGVYDPSADFETKRIVFLLLDIATFLGKVSLPIGVIWYVTTRFRIWWHHR